eukprot:176834_1
MNELAIVVKSQFSGSPLKQAAAHELQNQFEALHRLKKCVKDASPTELLANRRALESLLLDAIARRYTCHSVAVWQALGACLVALYAGTDGTGLTETVVMLQTELVKKHEARITLFNCLGSLVSAFGDKLRSFFSETLVISLKHLKSSEVALRLAVLQTVRGSVKGARREIPYAVVDLTRVLSRAATDRNDDVRILAAKCLAEACVFSPTLGHAETFANICVKSLSDSSPAVAFAFAEAFGSILARCARPGAHTEVGKSAHARVKAGGNGVLPAEGIVENFVFLQQQFLKATTPHIRRGLAQTTVRLFRNSRKSTDDQKIEVLLRKIVSLVPDGKLPISDGTLDCAAFMLRFGQLAALDERGLVLAGECLLKLLGGSLNHSQMIVTLRELGYIFHSLGSAAFDMKDTALEVLLPLLSSPSHGVRIRVGQVLRVFARALPCQLATLLRVLTSVTRMHLSDTHGDDTTMFSLHGHSHALAQLVDLVPEIPSGVPASLIVDAFTVSQFLLNPTTIPKSDAYDASCVLSVCGWDVVTVLIRSGPQWCSPRLKQLFNMWREELLKKPFKPRTRIQARSQLEVKIQATLALREIVHLFRHKIDQHPKFLAPIVNIADGLLTLVTRLQKEEEESTVVTPEPFSRALAGAVLEVFLALPPAAARAHFVPLLKVAVALLTSREPVALSHSDNILDANDSVLDNVDSVPFKRFKDLLTPTYQTIKRGFHWAPFNSTEPAEMQLQVLHVYSSHLWSLGDAALSGTEIPRPFPDRAPACNSAARLFARIFPFQNAHHKKQLLEHFRGVIKNSSSQLSESDSSSVFMDRWKGTLKGISMPYSSRTSSPQSVVIENVAVTIFQACREMLRVGAKFSPSSDVLTLVLRITQDLMSSPSVRVRRASSEIMGIVARLEGPEVTAQLVNFLTKQFHSKNRYVQATAALAMGSIHTYVGALKSMPFMALTVASLQSLGRATDHQVRLWVLHSLWKTVGVGGSCASSYIHPTLSLAMSNLVIGSGDTLDRSIHCVLARVLHILLSTIGTDSQEGSDSQKFQMCLWVLEHLKPIDHSLVASELLHCSAELLESTPLLRPVDSELVRSVDRALSSRVRVYRLTGVACLGRLADLWPEKLLEWEVLQKMFETLDSEPAAQMQDPIRAALSSATRALTDGPSHAHALVGLCQLVVEGRSRAGGDERRRSDPDDEEEEEEETESTKVAKDSKALFESDLSHCRVHTKVRACELLGELLQGNASETVDHKKGKTVQLSAELQPILVTACRAATALQTELQIAGLRLIDRIVQHFGLARDPDLPTDYLLTQHQAQLSSALRPLLSNDTEPEVRAAASDVVARFLRLPIAGSVFSRRAIESLTSTLHSDCAYLMSWGDLHSGHMQSTVTLSHLATLCNLWRFATDHTTGKLRGSSRSGIPKAEVKHAAAILGILTPQIPLILSSCLKALVDNVILAEQPRKVLRNHVGTFFRGEYFGKMRPVFATNWLRFLDVAAGLLDSAGSSEVNLQSVSLLVGISTKSLAEGSFCRKDEPSGDSDDFDEGSVCLKALSNVLRHHCALLDEDTVVEILQLLGDLISSEISASPNESQTENSADVFSRVSTILDCVLAICSGLGTNKQDGATSFAVTHGLLEVFLSPVQNILAMGEMTESVDSLSALCMDTLRRALSDPSPLTGTRRLSAQWLPTVLSGALRACRLGGARTAEKGAAIVRRCCTVAATASGRTDSSSEDDTIADFIQTATRDTEAVVRSLEATDPTYRVRFLTAALLSLAQCLGEVEVNTQSDQYTIATALFVLSSTPQLTPTIHALSPLIQSGRPALALLPHVLRRATDTHAPLTDRAVALAAATVCVRSLETSRSAAAMLRLLLPLLIDLLQPVDSDHAKVDSVKPDTTHYEEPHQKSIGEDTECFNDDFSGEMAGENNHTLNLNEVSGEIDHNGFSETSSSQAINNETGFNETDHTKTISNDAVCSQDVSAESVTSSEAATSTEAAASSLRCLLELAAIRRQEFRVEANRLPDGLKRRLQVALERSHTENASQRGKVDPHISSKSKKKSHKRSKHTKRLQKASSSG